MDSLRPEHGMAPALTIALTLCATLAVLAILRRRQLRKGPLPPGPPGLPIIGNVLEVPASNYWLKYKEWSEKYGSDVIYLNMVGTPVIVLNSWKASKDLLESRSSIYSSRPKAHMLTDVIGCIWNFGFQEYGPAWKDARALFQRAFSPLRMRQDFRPIALALVRSTLNQHLDDPDHFMDHNSMFSSLFILSTAYGIDVKSGSDNIHVQHAKHGATAMATVASGAYLVDALPSLRHLPSWFPGASFKRDAKVWSRDINGLADSPLQFVLDSMSAGTAQACVATELLGETDGPSEQHKQHVRGVLGTAYAAGTDTTGSTLGTFILAMMQHQDLQKKAQAAVDSFFSLSDGLPDFSGYGNIPYIEALIRELLRWRPPNPAAIPHAATQDDVYNGYYIPAGSIVIGNTWAILHDEDLYGPNTGAFNPSRFLDPTETAINPDMPTCIETFGYGRRQCPGLHIALELIWIYVVSALAVYDIRPSGDPSDEEGEYMTTGISFHPLPFKCQFVPRSDIALENLRAHV